MKKSWLCISLALSFALLFSQNCRKPEESKLVPADEELLTKPVDKLTIKDMKKLRVLVKTNFGSFVIAFYPEQAPHLTRNFIKLVSQGFYDHLNFHMVIPRYMLIAGDPKGDGTGGPGYWIKSDLNFLPHKRGTVGMSHPPFAPDQVGSQFYILLNNSIRESNAYPVFGYVESGMEVCDRIGEVPTSGQLGKPLPWAPQTKIVIEKMSLIVEQNP